MAELRNLSDFLRQRLTVDRNVGIVLVNLPDGRWQASMEHADKSHTVETLDDPVDVLWNLVVPFSMRRRLADDPFHQAKKPWWIELTGGVIRERKGDNDLDDLLGSTPTPAKTASPISSDLDDLLG